MFVPAFVAAACLFLDKCLARTSQLHTAPPVGGPVTLPGSLIVAAAAAGAGYLIAGAATRAIYLAQIEAGTLSPAVRLAAAIALLAAVASLVWRHRLASWLRAPAAPTGMLAGVAVLAVAAQLWQLGIWARTRAETNYLAARAVGQRLADGTLVQGKLANGLALESRIRPLFIGNGFGNYEDRLRRDDARYILTYDLPRIGYESSDGSGLIQGILEQYPRRQIVDSFIVDETPLPDRAVLIDKFPEREAGHARD
jgi:hypothetical protein